MKEYEIVARFCNACAGSSKPQIFIEELELKNTDDYVRMKHGPDFEKFSKKTVSNVQTIYHYDNGSVSYTYEFNEI